MKKKIISIVIPIIVLALLLCVYLAISKIDTSKPDDTEKNTITEYLSLLSVPSDTIMKCGVKTPEYDYTLVRNGEEWKIEGKEFIRLDSVSVGELIKSAAVINADDVIEKPENLSVYGLDSLVTGEVDIVTDDGEYNMKIGNAAPTQDRYYITFNNDERVYTLYNATVQAIIQNPDNLRLKNLHNITEEGLMRQDEFVSLSIVKPSGENISIRRKTAEEIERDIAANAFIMDAPYHKNINTDTFEEYAFKKFPYLKVVRYIEDAPSDWARYGLDSSQKTVLKFRTVSETLELEIGKEENGLYYAKLPNEDSVFTLSANELSILSLETFKLLDPSIYLAYIKEVRSIDFKAGEDTFTFRIEDLGDDKYKYYANDAEVEEEKFYQIYQEIIALSFTAPTGGEVTGEADYEYTFNFYDGREDNVKFISENERSYAAVVNGKTEFSLDKGQVKALVDKVVNFK